MPKWGMQPLSENRIALVSDNLMDRLVFEQALSMHPDTISCDYFSSKTRPDTFTPYKVTLTRNNRINDFEGYQIVLDDYRVRIGDIIDQIESVILRPLQNEVITRDLYCLDWAQDSLSINGHIYPLTAREKEIAYALLCADETGCTRNDLLNRIWGYRADLETHTLETHIYRLRQKIESDPTNPLYLVTTHYGYAFV